MTTEEATKRLAKVWELGWCVGRADVAEQIGICQAQSIVGNWGNANEAMQAAYRALGAVAPEVPIDAIHKKEHPVQVLCAVSRGSAKYDVHIYAVVRIKVSNVEAKDPSEAAKRAEASVNKDELFPKKTHASGLLTDNAEEVVGYHVDPLDAQGKPLADKSVLLNANCVSQKTKLNTGELVAQSKASPNVICCWRRVKLPRNTLKASRPQS